MTDCFATVLSRKQHEKQAKPNKIEVEKKMIVKKIGENEAFAMNIRQNSIFYT